MDKIIEKSIRNNFNYIEENCFDCSLLDFKVIYSKNGIHINVFVFFDRSEIDITIEQLEMELRIETLARYFELNMQNYRWSFHDEEGLEKAIEQRAQILRELIDDYHILDEQVFMEVYKASQKEQKEKAEQHYRDIDLNKAESLFKEGRYLEAGSLYKKHQQYLKKSERMKLEICERNIKQYK